MPKNFHIVLNDGFWDLRADGVPRAISRHKTRDEAIRVGRAAAARLKVSLSVEDEDHGDEDPVPSSPSADNAIARMAAA